MMEAPPVTDATPTAPTSLALDFDGVVCDGLLEYFQTAWKAYVQVFQPHDPDPPAGLAERFYALRPVVESGWEMPLVLYGLLSGVTDEAIADHWPELIPTLLTQAEVTAATLGQAVDGVRDRWIDQDLGGWLGLHRFYPGVLARIQQALDQGVDVTVISTKEGRFIQQLLTQQGLTLPPDRIFGKEVKQPKYDTLRQLRAAWGEAPLTLWFVEDRIKALQAVQAQSDLADVQLFLADWGYNLPRDRACATQDERLHGLSLEQFTADFGVWLKPLA
jgi:phosphoglycolate phosphatase-like HAD superfamily hydrolase